MVSPVMYKDVESYFHFWPSRSLAIVALSIYIFVALSVLAVTIRTRAWYMLIASAVGFMEMGGYACRISMLKKPQYGVYVAMQCLLIIPPSFLALVQYLTLGKAITAMLNAKPIIQTALKPRVVVWGYFTAEIASLAFQGAGAGLSVSQDTKPKNAPVGRALLIIGLALLVLLMISYLATAILVYVSSEYEVRKSRSLRTLFHVLFLSTMLLLTRNVFRLVEFSSGGFYNPISTKEVYFYVFDSLLIALILVIYTVFHFGIFFNKFHSEVERIAPTKLPIGTV